MNEVVHIMLNHVTLAHTPLVSLFVRRRVPLVAMHCVDIKLPLNLVIISKNMVL